jgi:hypothetical protein
MEGSREERPVNTNLNGLCAHPLSPGVHFASRFVHQCFFGKKIHASVPFLDGV